MKSKFERNITGKSTYTCGSCGRNTRETGLGESGCGLCAFCFEEGGFENMLSDGHITQEQFDIEIAALRKQYKRPVLGAPVTGLLVTEAEDAALTKAENAAKWLKIHTDNAMKAADAAAADPTNPELADKAAKLAAKVAKLVKKGA